MGAIFIFLKVYPFFGVSLFFLCVDLARTMRRRGQRIWTLFVILGFLFAVTTLLWLVFRGDKHSDEWFVKTLVWLQLR